MTPLATPANALDRLVASIRGIVARGSTPLDTAVAVATVLEAALAESDLLSDEQQQPGPDGYRQHILHVEPDDRFSVVALVWRAGQATPIHDHVSWCTTGVYRGEETETRYRLTGDRLVPTTVHANRIGMTAAVAPPGDIHKVSNQGTDVAISLHVYGADVRKLGSSIRRRYDPVAAPVEVG